MSDHRSCSLHSGAPRPHFKATSLRPTFVISCQGPEVGAKVPSEAIWPFGSKPRTATPGTGRGWRC